MFRFIQFKFQIICICFDEDCNKYEKEYITKFKSIYPNGYNLKEGGKNSHHHPDTIKKLSDKLKGRKLSKEHHPDRGGNEETFKDVAAAYDILSDPEKKQNFDMFGDAKGNPNPFSGGFGGFGGAGSGAGFD